MRYSSWIVGKLAAERKSYASTLHCEFFNLRLLHKRGLLNSNLKRETGRSSEIKSLEVDERKRSSEELSSYSFSFCEYKKHGINFTMIHAFNFSLQRSKHAKFIRPNLHSTDNQIRMDFRIINFANCIFFARCRKHLRRRCRNSF